MKRSGLTRRKPLVPKGLLQSKSELQRTTPLTRGHKVPAAGEARDRGEAFTVQPRRRTPLAPRSLKRAGEEQQYRKSRRGFLAANPFCRRCGRVATEVHHMAGRRGRMLLEVDLWCPLCHDCHQHVTEHPTEAVEQGYSVSRVAS